MAINSNVLAENQATVLSEDGNTLYATIQMRHGKEADMDKSKFVRRKWYDNAFVERSKGITYQLTGGIHMFKNCVFKVSVDTKKWLKAAGIRAVKTMAQTAVGVIGAGTVISAVDWKMAASAAVVAGVVSVLTSVAGIPEVVEE